MNSFQTWCDILPHCNKQNLEIIERMQAGNGKQGIVLLWPNYKLWPRDVVHSIVILATLQYVPSLASWLLGLLNFLSIISTKLTIQTLKHWKGLQGREGSSFVRKPFEGRRRGLVHTQLLLDLHAKT